MTTALVNGSVLFDGAFRAGLAVLIDAGIIVDVVASDEPRALAATRQDLAGRRLVAGFIDIQVNGGGGVLFNDAPHVGAIRRIGAAHRRFGTTGFLPTLISDDATVMRHAIAAVDAAILEGVPGVLGIHLEGPYIAPERRGAHDAARFRALDEGEMELVCGLRHGVTVLTLAPERVSPAIVRALTARGVIVCIGHSAASYDEACAALAAGARGFTHLYNAMSPLQARAPGVVGAALEDRDSWCGLIVDGQHVHAAALRIALAAKPRDKLILVTDAMPPVGAAVDHFVLSGMAITCRDGRCETVDGVLAGSVLDMAGAVRNSIAMLGVSPEQAVQMASANAADFLGLSSTRGRIQPGLAADLVALDDDGMVSCTWIAGIASRDNAPA